MSALDTLPLGLQKVNASMQPIENPERELDGCEKAMMFQLVHQTLQLC